MNWNGWLQIALFAAIVAALVKPVGLYMTKVMGGERTWLSPVLCPVERLFYGLSGVRENEDQHWLAYALAMRLFNAAGFFLLYAILRLQQGLGQVFRLRCLNLDFMAHRVTAGGAEYRDDIEYLRASDRFLVHRLDGEQTARSARTRLPERDFIAFAGSTMHRGVHLLGWGSARGQRPGPAADCR